MPRKPIRTRHKSIKTFLPVSAKTCHNEPESFTYQENVVPSTWVLASLHMDGEIETREGKRMHFRALERYLEDKPDKLKALEEL